MKSVLFTLFLLTLPWNASGQGADTLASVTADYTKKRTDGLLRLTNSAKAALESVKKAQMAVGNLDGANATDKAIRDLPAGVANPAATPDETATGLPADASVVISEHTFKVCNGIIGLNRLFVPKYEALKAQLLQTGDLPGANAAAAKVTQLNDEASQLTPMAAAKNGRKAELAKSFTVEGLVDGDTELHITTEGIYWVVLGDKAKVGHINGNNDPTYVDGVRWKPKWRTQGDRGPDTSDVYPFPSAAINLAAEQVSVTERRFGKEIKRTASTHTVKDNHLVVHFKDPEGGGAWYKLRFKVPEEK